jgi:hypothetical protein
MTSFNMQRRATIPLQISRTNRAEDVLPIPGAPHCSTETLVALVSVYKVLPTFRKGSEAFDLLMASIGPHISYINEFVLRYAGLIEDAEDRDCERMKWRCMLNEQEAAIWEALIS